jgi:putative two-component system response regulator
VTSCRHPDARILVVDDLEANVVLLERMLKAGGYTRVERECDSRAALERFERSRPDLVLLDLHMPHMDGFAVLERLAELTDGEYLPTLVLTADVTAETKRRALAAGARDFLAKPLDHSELLLRIANLLETRFLHQELTNANARLEDAVAARTHELREAVTSLERAHEDTLQRLAVAAEARDDDTASHVSRMSRYCGHLARLIGEDERRCEVIRLASQLHDVGKIAIPDSILRKPGPLTPEERVVMQRHAEIGHRILGGSGSELLRLAATIALNHHEHIDGNGYPRGLRGDEIPLEARIAAVADVFDALMSDRVYRKAYPLPAVVDIMREQRGSQFDEDLVDAFLGDLDGILGLS